MRPSGFRSGHIHGHSFRIARQHRTGRIGRGHPRWRRAYGGGNLGRRCDGRWRETRPRRQPIQGPGRPESRALGPRGRKGVAHHARRARQDRGLQCGSGRTPGRDRVGPASRRRRRDLDLRHRPSKAVEASRGGACGPFGAGGEPAQLPLRSLSQGRRRRNHHRQENCRLNAGRSSASKSKYSMCRRCTSSA
jgi:hypothetical protein